MSPKRRLITGFRLINELRLYLIKYHRCFTGKIHDPSRSPRKMHLDRNYYGLPLKLWDD
jgi:hypothetical protein